MSRVARRLLASFCFVFFSLYGSATAFAAISADLIRSFGSQAESMDLGFGITPLGDKGVVCFETTQDLRNELKGGETTYFLWIEDGSEEDYKITSRKSQQSLGGGGSIGITQASGSLSQEMSNTREIRRDERSIIVTLHIKSLVSTDNLKDFKLTGLGQTYLQLGPRSFIESCGALIVTEITKSLDVEIEIQFQYKSFEEKLTATNSLIAKIGARYGPYSANANFSSSLDEASGAKEKIATVSTRARIRGENGISGLDKFTAALKDLETKPFQSIVVAVSELLAEKKSDKGAISSITVQNYDLLLPSFSMTDWARRERLWTKGNDLAHSLHYFHSILSGKKADPKLSSRENVLRKAIADQACEIIYFDAGLVSQRENGLGILLCMEYQNNGDSIFDELQSRIATAISRCLSATKSVEVDCDEFALVSALSPLIQKGFGRKRLAASDYTPPPDHPSSVNSGPTPSEWPIIIYNAALDAVIVDNDAWRVSLLTSAGKLTECCALNHPNAIPDDVIENIRNIRNIIDRPVKLYGWAGDSYGEIEINGTYASNVSTVWLRVNTAATPVGYITYAKNTVIDSHYTNDAAVEPYHGMALWYANTSACVGCGTSISSEVARSLKEYKEAYGDVFFTVMTHEGITRHFLSRIYASP